MPDGNFNLENFLAKTFIKMSSSAQQYFLEYYLSRLHFAAVNKSIRLNFNFAENLNK